MIKKILNGIKNFYARIYATNRIAGIGAVAVTLFIIYSVGIFVYSTNNPIQQRDKSLPNISVSSEESAESTLSSNPDIYHINFEQTGDAIKIDLGVVESVTPEEAMQLAIDCMHEFETAQGWVIPEGQRWSAELKQYEIDFTIDKETETDEFPIFGTKMQNVDEINWMLKDGTRVTN